jgi:TatD DNase family protein
VIDSHTHIYGEEFDSDRDAVVQRARDAGVTHVILPNENMASIARLQTMQHDYPQYVSLAIGLHPEEIDGNFRDQLTAMRPLLDRDKYVGIGEIGIDLYWDKTWRDEQMEALDTQLHWCVDLDLPFIIHCRAGLDECLDVFANFGTTLPRGVFHSFTGTADDIERIRRYGDFYFGVNGIVTFKKSTVPALLPVIGLDRLLLETDSPYLAPVPRRGTRNESSNIPYINDCIAKHLNLTPQQVSQATDNNVQRLFSIF